MIENFRPGRLEEWGLGFDVLAAANPAVVLVHISGFGQTGPRAGEAGFGSIGEAVGGIRHTTGSPDRPPSRAGVSLGDALAAMFGVIGALAALTEARQTGRGQEVDVAIYEAVAALMESSMADLELGGVLRGRSGSTLPGVAPSNVYPTADGAEVVIAGNADSVFARLCQAMDQPELSTDERYATHGRAAPTWPSWTSGSGRGRRRCRRRRCSSAWRRTGFPPARSSPPGRCSPTRSTWPARWCSATSRTRGGRCPMNGIVPRFTRTPGAVRHTGQPLGHDTEAVLRELAGCSDDELDELAKARLI